MVDCRKTFSRAVERQQISWHFMLWLVMPKKRISQLEQISKVLISKILSSPFCSLTAERAKQQSQQKGVLSTLKRNYQAINLVDQTQNQIEERKMSVNQMPSLPGQNTEVRCCSYEQEHFPWCDGQAASWYRSITVAFFGVICRRSFPQGTIKEMKCPIPLPVLWLSDYVENFIQKELADKIR